jgi:hypothetical protein
MLVEVRPIDSIPKTEEATARKRKISPFNHPQVKQRHVDAFAQTLKPTHLCARIIHMKENIFVGIGSEIILDQ